MKIRSVVATWIRVPIPEDRQHVSDFGRSVAFDTSVVRIDTACGQVGWGEAKDEVGSSSNGLGLAALINHKLGPRLIGEDPRDINRLWDVMYNGPRDHYALAHGRGFPILGRRGTGISAISGIDMALWDLLGKSLGVPVSRLLGGARQPSLPAYASGGWADVDGIGAQLLGYVAQGNFRAVKMRVGIIDGSVDRSVARVRAARDALGPDIALMCDAHGTWSVADAKRFCRQVEDCNLAWLEEPVTADDHRGLAAVRAATDLPIAVGESEFTRFDFLDVALHGGADIFQPDLAICGGISEAVRIGHLASAFNLRLAPHLWTGALAFAAGLHVTAASPAGFILEYALGANPLLHELTARRFEVVDGRITVPESPGLGVDVDEAFVARYAVSA